MMMMMMMDLCENFTREDASLDKEVSVKFWESSTSRNFLEDCPTSHSLSLVVVCALCVLSLCVSSFGLSLSLSALHV